MPGSGSFRGDTPERRVRPLVLRLLSAMAARREATLEALADDEADVREALLEAYRLGTEHGEITGEWDRLVER